MHHEGEEAEGLLSAWTSLWHPALLATTGSAPTWHRGDSPPGDPSQMLIVVPGVSENELPTGFAQRARDEGACVIQGNLPRDEILRQALEPIAALAAGIDAELVADFLALGYGYLQIELLTRQMRYSTNLDELHFYNQAVAGAKAAAAGEVDAAREQLTACFDLLAQERDHYYAVDAYVLDLTLIATTTLGPALAAELGAEVPSNLLLTGSLVEQMAAEFPESFAAVQRGLEEGYVGLIGGDQSEERAPMHSCETVLRKLQLGLSTFHQQLGHQPRVYGRRRYGLTVLHPQLLNRLGYLGALHAVLSDGRYPEGSQLKVRWEGPDHQAIDAISRVPLDAAQAATFLSLASKLGETMDMDHVATICLAHWPGRVCTWYHDLRRVARHGALLGKFVTVDEYFRDTDYPGQTEHFKADQYRSPYLRQSIANGESNPLSTSVRYWRQRSRVTALEALQAMLAAIGQRTLAGAAALVREVDAAADAASQDEVIDSRIDQALAESAQQFAEQVPRADAGGAVGFMVLNPSINVRRAVLDLPQLKALPTPAKPVYAAAADGEHKYVVVDVPPMGFVWVEPSQTTRPSRRTPPVLADEHRLFNEYFELNVNPTTGALQSLYEYEKRGNRLSQQLAVRGARDQQAGSQSGGPYSVMAADKVRVTAASTVMGEITASGRLLDRRGKTLATFEQVYRAWRGRRVLELEIQLDPLVELNDEPWRSYICSRWAWASESAILWRAVNQLRERAEAKQFEAPNYIEIDDAGRRTTLLTGGLPYHRRANLRMLDSLLIVKGEKARSFKLGIGIDVAYPLQESLAQLAPVPVVELNAPPPRGANSGWLFHVDSRNVTATAWEPVVEAEALVGVSVRLLETAGRPARATLQTCHPIIAAERCDFQGQGLGACQVEDGVMSIELGANEWIQAVLRWA